MPYAVLGDVLSTFHLPLAISDTRRRRARQRSQARRESQATSRTNKLSLSPSQRSCGLYLIYVRSQWDTAHSPPCIARTMWCTEPERTPGYPEIPRCDLPFMTSSRIVHPGAAEFSGIISMYVGQAAGGRLAGVSPVPIHLGGVSCGPASASKRRILRLR